MVSVAVLVKPWLHTLPGACPGFLKGGVVQYLLVPKKRSSDFERGVQWSEGGGGSSTFVSLGRQILHI